MIDPRPLWDFDDPTSSGERFLDAAEQADAENLGGGLAENLLAAAEFNAEQGEIPEAAPAEDFEGAVDASYAEAVG